MTTHAQTSPTKSPTIIARIEQFKPELVRCYAIDLEDGHHHAITEADSLMPALQVLFEQVEEDGLVIHGVGRAYESAFVVLGELNVIEAVELTCPELVLRD